MFTLIVVVTVTVAAALAVAVAAIVAATNIVIGSQVPPT